jgi:IclR family acetate operon transcriptional repressor
MYCLLGNGVSKLTLPERTMPRTGQPAIRHVAAVQRAVAVLDALADGTAELGTNEIARRTGINASTVSRLLATLADAGLVEHVAGTGRYRLGMRLLQLGNAVLARIDLREVARPHLAALVEATGETATLSAPGEHEAVTVDFVQSASFVQSVAQVGRPSAAHATAVGKVFLAHGGRLRDGELEAFTARTITNRAHLAAELERVRVRGYAQAVGEREEALNAIAAPVLDVRGALAAILGVQGPSSRFDEARMRAALEPLLEHSTTVSAALGHHPHAPHATEETP